MGFFKKAALFIAGGALAYEFIAGIIEEKFGIDMPTIKEMFTTAKEFSKEMENFDWKSASIAISVLGGMAVGLTAFSGLIRGATAGLASLGALGKLIKSRFPTTNPGAVPRPGAPTVNPGAPGTNPNRGPDGVDRRSRQVRREEARALAKEIFKGGQAANAAPGAAAAAAATGGGWWEKFKLAGKAAKLPGGLAGVTVAADAFGLLGGDEMMAAGTDQYELLDAIKARGYSYDKALEDATTSAIAGGVVGGGVGLLGGPAAPATVAAGVLSGALSGAIWGTITGAGRAVVRAFKDSGEGIDELPNSVEEALREELAFKGQNNDPKYFELVSATRKAASDFLEKAYAEVAMAEVQIEDAEAKLAAGGLAPPEINRLQKNIEELKEKKKLLDMQIQHTEETDRTRSQFFLPNGNRNVSQAEIDALNAYNAIIDGENLSDDDYYKNIMASLATGQGQPVVMHRGGDVNNFNMTAANRSSSAIYKSSIGFGGGSGGGYRGQALPGLVS
jgi:FtsZ-binding cell division protein ZapB